MRFGRFLRLMRPIRPIRPGRLAGLRRRIGLLNRPARMRRLAPYNAAVAAITLGLVFASAAAGGCSSLRVRVETVVAPNASIAAVKRVVLLPLVNRSDDPGAALAVAALIAKNVTTYAHLKIVDCPPGIQVDAERLDREQARDLAAAAAADAVMTGIVFAYGYVSEQGSAPRPTVRFDVRLFAAGTPDLEWAARATGSDSPGMASAGASLTTIADATAQQVAQDLATRK